MKKAILISACALFASSNINAQITLNQASYTSSPVGTDSLKVTTAGSLFPSFAPATNAMWDLSTVTDSSAILFGYHVADALTPATYADSNFYSFGTNAYQGNVQANIAASGLLHYGIDIQRVAYTLSVGDTIFVPAQNGTFTVTDTVIKFPATMGNTWSNSYESDFNYQLTYVPGYTHAPGIVKSYITEKNTVIGWGQMRIKSAVGAPSGYSQVLQVRTQTTTTDSFFLNGTITDPAIPTLLNLLGASQGQVTKTYAQNFYRVNEITPLAYVLFADSANTTPTKVTTHVQRLSPNGVADVNNDAAVKIYPNPVSGRILSVDVPISAGEWRYELMNVAGQTVASEALRVNSGHAQVQLAGALTAGIYYFRILNGNNQVAMKALEIN